MVRGCCTVQSRETNMNVYIDRTGKPDDGIVFQRGLMEFWVPSTMQSHLPYNPRHLPVVPIRVGFQPADPRQPYPSDYIYIASDKLLWTCWRKFKELTVERR